MYKSAVLDMIELSLWGQIPQVRHDQIIQILAGVAAMSPNPISERHYLFRPAQPPSRKIAQVGGTQGITNPLKAARQVQNNGDVYYLRLVESIDRSMSNSSLHAVDHEMQDSTLEQDKVGATTIESSTVPSWMLYFHDVPEAGKRPVVVRSMTCIQIREGDASAFMQGLGYV